MSGFSLDVGGDGVAIITWDLPGKSMNVMSLDALRDLDACIDRVLADDAIKGAVITSGKASFAAGMDLGLLATLRERFEDAPAKGVFEGTMALHALLRKIELAGMDRKTKTGGKPIAAALTGTALGIGYELPLACHRIFAAEGTGKIGLPEIKVGLFPGAGGTTRLVRKMGAMAAAPYLLEGKTLAPDKALKAGLIDAVVAPGELLAAAREWVLGATDADLVKPWDAKGYKMPGGTPFTPAGFPTFLGASVMVNARTKGVYPAAKALLSAVYEGALLPFEEALKVEARWFTKVVLDPVSGAMIRSLFLNKGALEKGAQRPKSVGDEAVRKLGVLGAGMMGAGIALVAAMAGIEVVLIDASQEAAEKGRAYSEAYMDKGIARGKATPETKAATLARITATTDYARLAGCDLVIEAVFEDPGVKAEVTAKAEAVLGDDAIFATNTSTLPITELARASSRPARFIGLHFFSPVEKMALVEIIKGRETGDRAVAKALDFARQIRKTPIVVNDARFFYANRCILPYLNEGIRMVGEGVAPWLVDHAAELLGFPVGPLQLTDEVSLDLGVKIARATKAAMGEAYPDADVDAVVFPLHEAGRSGRKAGAGFYAYDERSKRQSFWEGLGEMFPVAGDQPDLQEVQDRLMMAQVLEAVRALEDGVLTDIREGDVGAILGWGFAPWSGGPFAWLDRIGAAQAVETCDRLEAVHGPRFNAPPLLRDMAAKGERFYDRFAPAGQAA